MTSAPEETLALLIRVEQLPEPERQFRFLKGRRYQADFCWPATEYRLICEVQGGGWNRGRHHRPQGYEDDCERLNAAICAGWRVVYVTPAMIADGRAIEWIRKALEMTA
jgi:hypothetical protein